MSKSVDEVGVDLTKFRVRPVEQRKVRSVLTEAAGQSTIGRVRSDVNAAVRHGESPVYSGSFDAHGQTRVMQKLEVVRIIAQGGTLKVAAKAVGVSVPTVRGWLRTPEMLAQVKELSQARFEEIYDEIVVNRESMFERARQAADEALDEMVALMGQTTNEHIKVKIAQDLMDRDPDRRVSRSTTNQQQITTVNIDAAALMTAAQAAAEIEAPRKQIRGRVEVETWDGEGNQR